MWVDYLGGGGGGGGAKGMLSPPPLSNYWGAWQPSSYAYGGAKSMTSGLLVLENGIYSLTKEYAPKRENYFL